MKLLESRSISYEAVAYPENERDAVVVAHHIGVSPDQVYKTLVVSRPSAKPILIMIAADRRLNLKKLAGVTGDKKLKMATHAEAEALTRLKVGGISPLALLNRGFLIYIDEAVRENDYIYISAGQKGINLKVSVGELIQILGARTAEVSDQEPG